jgi:hypothetical protein
MTPESLQTATLTSLAMLKVHADAKGRRDYVDYLKPFAVHVLMEHRPFPVSRERLQDILLQEFGLKVPVRGCELILKRLSKAGYLQRSHGTYSLKRDLPASDIKERRVDAIRRGNSVVMQLAEFAKTDYKIEYDTTQATKAFLSFVSVFSIECLSTYSNRTALPDIKDRSSKEIHLVAAFIKAAESKNLSLFEDIALLVKGNMLANALLCEDLESQQQKFKDVIFYLDTPILLDIIGLHGKRELNAAMELLLSVTKLSGVFATFEHIIDETENVLVHCERNVSNPRLTSRVLTHIREEGLQGSDIALIRNNLRKQLKDYGIQIQRTPKYEASYQIDENSFQAVLEASSKYPNPNARNTDINSVRSIYVLRANRRPRRLEEAKAVLVTPNWRFAKESYRFGQQYEESKEVSPVITEFGLGNIAWLKSPLETENLPKLELMASCYAIMEPSREFWGKFLVEAEKLKNAGKLSSDDHAFLRSDHRVSNELMELTLGAEEELTEGTITEIKERITKSLTREKNAELRLKEKELQVESMERKKLVLQNQRVINKIDTFCVRVAKTVATIVGLLASALLVGGILLPFLPIVSFPKAVSWVFFGGAALLALVTFLNLIFGVTMQRTCLQVLEKSTAWLNRALLGVLGLGTTKEQ